MAAGRIAQITRQSLQTLDDLTDASSWHNDYTSPYIHYSSLSYSLTEGDIITIFSQYGEVLDIHLMRDKDSGKSRGYGWLRYEDLRSCILAVDNLNGSVILERKLLVDRVAEFKFKDRDEINLGLNCAPKRFIESANGNNVENDLESNDARDDTIDKELTIEALGEGLDPEDPMFDYMINERREKILADRIGDSVKKEEKHSNHRRHRRSRRSRSRSHSPNKSHDKEVENYSHREDRDKRQSRHRHDDESSSRRRKHHRHSHKESSSNARTRDYDNNY